MRSAIITECEECPYVRMYLGTTEQCRLSNIRVCYPNENSPDIPTWCKLQKPTKKEIENMVNLEKTAGLKGTWVGSHE